MRRESLALFLLLGIFSAEAQERLLSGPGSTLTENKCKICHELQHIRRSPLSRGEWADNLKNMKERGTPMSDAEMATILDYLAVYYNRETPAPPEGPDTLVSSGSPIEKLLGGNGCTACHAVDRKVLGPAFRDVAKKYAGDTGAAARLAAKIKAGGQGNWGNVPMPPHPALSEQDLQTLAGWVLQQK